MEDKRSPKPSGPLSSASQGILLVSLHKPLLSLKMTSCLGRAENWAKNALNMEPETEQAANATEIYRHPDTFPHRFLCTECDTNNTNATALAKKHNQIHRHSRGYGQQLLQLPFKAGCHHPGEIWYELQWPTSHPGSPSGCCACVSTCHTYTPQSLFLLLRSLTGKMTARLIYRSLLGRVSEGLAL